MPQEKAKTSTTNAAKKLALSVLNRGSEELATAAIAHTFKTAPEHFIHLVPEEKRSIKQTIISTVLDQVINVSSASMVKVGASVPVCTAICSTAALTKTMILTSPEVSKKEKLKSISLQDVKDIVDVAAQNGIAGLIEEKMAQLTETINDRSPAMFAAKIAGQIFITPAIQSMRIPNSVLPVPPKDQHLLQKVGHMVANAGIAASVGVAIIGLFTAKPDLVKKGLIGSGVGVLLNSGLDAIGSRLTG